jgi:hypothetical protein
MVVACIYDDSGTWQYLKPALQVFMLSITCVVFMNSANVSSRRVYHFAKFSAEVGSETENITVMEKSIPLMLLRFAWVKFLTQLQFIHCSAWPAGDLLADWGRVLPIP